MLVTSSSREFGGLDYIFLRVWRIRLPMLENLEAWTSISLELGGLPLQMLGYATTSGPQSSSFRCWPKVQLNVIFYLECVLPNFQNR